MRANKCIFTLNHLGNYHMKNYYVMGYKPEKNMIQNIVSVAYFVKDLAHCKNYEDYPFYRKSDIKSFKSLFMVTKDFKKYTFDILSDPCGNDWHLPLLNRRLPIRGVSCR